MKHAQYRAMIRDLCAELGVAIIPQGRAFRLRGRGVDLMVLDLASVQVHELLN